MTPEQRVLGILGDLVAREPGQTLLAAWAKAWDRVTGECLCPHTLEPGAEGIHDPLCPIPSHAKQRQTGNNMIEPNTAEEKVVLDLTAEELAEIATAMQRLGGGGFSTPIRSIELKHPPKRSVVEAWTPALRNGGPVKWATFYNAGQNGGNLARALKLAVRYLGLLPAAVDLFRRSVDELETLREKLRVAEVAADELGCVVDTLDALSVPTEMAPGVPYTVHGRVGDAITKARDEAGTRNTPK